ncbi:PDZ and LIM domain protein 2-like [Ctenopharyngodon idella]|uniref:PDZ and LIM domain protein 2-like n=1 Tax=Ctenopharyngodon idella TaxID=7959 RepID=UPI0022329FD3|nr:PDZ and LIM domain protein 2-like [Ctenopharyngodon idella]
MTFRVNLTGPPPWGFRICGGRDFKRTLTVSKVHEGSRAGDAGLQAGDAILEINGQDAGAMLNVEAQNKIKINEHQLCLLIERPTQTAVMQRCDHPDPRLPVNSEPSVRPKQTHESVQGQSKSSQSFRAPLERNCSPNQLKQHDQKDSTTSGHNFASDWIPTCKSQTTKKRVSFNYPVWSYGPVDPEELMRIKSMQVQPQRPRQSNTFRILQEGLERTSQPFGAIQHNQRFRTCERCGYVIVTQAVRVREGRYRHVECYTCRDCDLSLMERGHFCVDKELYCGKHFRQRCHHLKHW